MSKSNKKELSWLPDVEVHDYPAAASYLSLIYNPDKVAQIVSNLKATTIVQFNAKDIFRASHLSLLGVSNSHVQKDSIKIENGIALSPLLLVRDEVNSCLIIADGYHRLCAIYDFDEDAMIYCKIV
jgi:disulfide oxidoreductase YuzD